MDPLKDVENLRSLFCSFRLWELLIPSLQVLACKDPNPFPGFLQPVYTTTVKPKGPFKRRPFVSHRFKQPRKPQYIFSFGIVIFCAFPLIFNTHTSGWKKWPLYERTRLNQPDFSSSPVLCAISLNTNREVNWKRNGGEIKQLEANKSSQWKAKTVLH